ncbi:hypothetical protein [Kitasatospora sp. GP82]|uniref:DUF7158 domain-containing protein n=1 Tax=Kitasatospora sp. GP82 TaxID=3035089 RepID=UPI002473A603|nr:hypothetical protein [Kitasatospora sp. GP82]MDH6124990.1 [acyl-carrier-protein] S-malonyltransferase [Kitasatospora sp. GP82]
MSSTHTPGRTGSHGHRHGNRHEHGHGHSDGTAHAHPVPEILGLLDGRPLPRTELDRRLAALRGGPRSSALPVPGSAEDRQLTRWVAQVVLTEQLCAAEAAARGLDTAAEATGRSRPARLDQRAAVELGSIAAAAFEGSAAVRAVYRAVTADAALSPDEAAAYRRATEGRAEDGPLWRIATPDGEFDARPQTLPLALAAALRTAGPGRTVTADGWTATLLTEQNAPVAQRDPAPELLEAARRIAFVRWLDHARAHRLTLVPGLEHPGDPAQPDNHHRH